MSEQWKDIIGYEGLYAISSQGRVKSCSKHKGTNYSMYCPEIILKPYVRCGYYVVPLSKHGRKKTYYLHRLIAIHFMPNPDQSKEVNHIDGDKLNFAITNLEWCTRHENEQHAWRTGLKQAIGEKHFASKPVQQLDLQGNVVKVWDNGSQAAKHLGFGSPHISKCCNGKLSSAYGFKWRFACA